jgi:hypothetical protein
LGTALAPFIPRAACITSPFWITLRLHVGKLCSLLASIKFGQNIPLMYPLARLKINLVHGSRQVSTHSNSLIAAVSITVNIEGRVSRWAITVVTAVDAIGNLLLRPWQPGSDGISRSQGSRQSQTTPLASRSSVSPYTLRLERIGQNTSAVRHLRVKKSLRRDTSDFRPDTIGSSPGSVFSEGGTLSMTSEVMEKQGLRIEGFFIADEATRPANGPPNNWAALALTTEPPGMHVVLP